MFLRNLYSFKEGAHSVGGAFALGWHHAVRRWAWAQRWLWLAFTLAFAALDLYLLLRVVLQGMGG